MRISDWSSDVCSSDLELDGQYVARLAGRKIPRRAVDRPHGAVREGFGIEGRGFERGAVEPEADRVPGDHLHSPKLVDCYGAGHGFSGLAPVRGIERAGGHAKACLLSSRRTMGCGIEIGRAHV